MTLNPFALIRPRQKLSFKILIVVEQDDARFHAFSPALTGLHADGDDPMEAAQNLAQDIPAYLQSLIKHGDPLPIGPDCTVEGHDVMPEIPPGAFLRHVTLQWPSLATSGIS